MGPEGIILVNPPITTFQQSLTHSALTQATSITDARFCEDKKGITNTVKIYF